MAAGLRTSVETRSGCRPSRVNRRPSLAVVVVFPHPCSPTSRDDLRTSGRLRKTFAGRAEQPQQLVAHYADHLLRGSQAVEHGAVGRTVPDAVDERLDDLEVDVRLQQREANIAQGTLHDLRRQPHLAAQRPEHLLHA